MYLTVCCGQEGCHKKNDVLPPHCSNVALSLDIWDFYRHAISLVKKQELTTLLIITLEIEKKIKISDIRNLQYFYLSFILNKNACNAL